MRTFVVLLATLSLASQAHGSKYRTYTLAELTAEADAIVVATITFHDGGTHATVLRSLKGNPARDVIVDSFAVRETEKAHFKEGETVILFLETEQNGRRLLLGYGDQGKWPKAVGKWPYSDVHVVSIPRVEIAVKTLLDIAQTVDRDAKAAKLKSLLSSKDAFDQAYALEYLDAAHDKGLTTGVSQQVNVLKSKSQDRYVRVIAQAVARATTTNGAK